VTSEGISTTGDIPAAPLDTAVVDTPRAPAVLPHEKTSRGFALRSQAAVAAALPVLGVYALVRFGLFVADLLVAHLDWRGDLGGPMQSWDARFYLQIAAHGYPSASATAGAHLTYSAAGFEPGFPLLARAVGTVLGSVFAGALVVSIVAGAVGTVLVWRLGSLIGGGQVGWRAAVLFAVFPGMALSWGLLYCESVGLALVAGSLLLMYRRQWFWAGVVGALATLTSPMALALAPAAAVPAIKDIMRRRLPAAGLTVLMVPVGFLAYAGWLGAHYHDALYWWHLQRQAWGVDVDFGKSLLALLPHFWKGGYQGKAWLEWIGIAAVLGGCFALWRAKVPGFVNAYCASALVVLFVSNNLGFKPRLLSWVFPALVAVAVELKGRAWQALVIVFASLLPVVFISYTTLGNVMIQP